MLIKFIKKALFIACLVTLSSCNTSPINVSGSISLKEPDTTWKPYIERDRAFLYVWFCPKDVKLRERTENAEYVWLVTYKTKLIAEKECFSAETNIKNLTYSIKNLPAGRYDVSVVLYSYNPDPYRLETMIWFGYIGNKSKELNFDIVDGQNSYYY